MVRLRYPVLALALVLVSACGDGTDTAAVTEISVTLQDGSIELSQGMVEGGSLSMEVVNEGTMVHEIEVFAGDETDLPVSNGVADTSGLTLIDEVEDIVPGATQMFDLDLEPGHYVIICNLPGHYELGMVTELTVGG